MRKKISILRTISFGILYLLQTGILTLYMGPSMVHSTDTMHFFSFSWSVVKHPAGICLKQNFPSWLIGQNN